MDQSSQTLAIGSQLHHYQIQSVLGEGGFGITYKAFNTRIKQLVAIKEYLPIDLAVRRSSDTQVLARSAVKQEEFSFGLQKFLEEARVLARFNHPNIVRAYDFFEENGTGYLVMEYADGQSLDELIKAGGALSEERIKHYFLPLLEGLEVVHQAGLLHRDIKPANIYIRSNGNSLLIDFGAARQAVGQHSKSVTGIVSQGYAPTEQYGTNSRKQGPWTDLYAVGATLYKCISAETPIDAPTRRDDIHDEGTDPLISANELGKGRYSQAVLDAIDQCLQVGIKQRPQNISELRLLLNGDYEAGKVADDGLNKTRKVTQDEAGFDEELAESEETRESKEDQEIFNNASPIPGKTKGLRAVGLCILVVVLGVGVYLGYQSYPRLGESAISAEATMDQMPDDLSLVGEFVVVPGGEFSMGDNDGGELEKPERIVSVRSFKLAKHEVTREQFARFVEDAGFTTDASRYGCYVYKDGKHGRYMGPTWKTPGIDQQDNHPVVCVSYFDALAYIEWLNEKTGNSYRLPTEAEWEYAARAGRKEPSEFTGDPDQSCKVGNSADMDALKVFAQWTYTSFCSDGHAVTAPVGSYAANGFGLKDMLGNVWEWNVDCIHSNYIGAPVDGSARTEGCDNTARVRRGGAWNLTLKYFSETVRTGFSSAASTNDTGFRLAEDL